VSPRKEARSAAWALIRSNWSCTVRAFFTVDEERLDRGMGFGFGFGADEAGFSFVADWGGLAGAFVVDLVGDVAGRLVGAGVIGLAGVELDLSLKVEARLRIDAPSALPPRRRAVPLNFRLSC
jgi:hypothetical protein